MGQGCDAIPDLKKIFLQAKFVVLSNREYGEKASANGADDFWNKTESTNKLPELVKKILAN